MKETDIIKRKIRSSTVGQLKQEVERIGKAIDCAQSRGALARYNTRLGLYTAALALRLVPRDKVKI